MAPLIPKHFTPDDIVIGAGAAGLFYAARAGERGRRVLVLDHMQKPAEKVRISGGGRCNFTNLHTTPKTFLSQNPHFAKSALARYTPQDFIARLQARSISWHEKTLGQLFCDGPSTQIVDMLVEEAGAVGGVLRLGVEVSAATFEDGVFALTTSHGPVRAPRLVIASGGLSIPKLGASGFAYDLARQFGHAVVAPRAGLVPFVLDQRHADLHALAGVSAPVRAVTADCAFREALLFTHRGLSGPAMLQASSYWRDGEPLRIDLLDGRDARALLRGWRTEHPKRTPANLLEGVLPKRLVDALAARGLIEGTARIADLSNARLDALGDVLSGWSLTPAGTEGWRTAEVTTGGVATDALSSKTMESRLAPGLFFIGECVDVTGWLGGYNFQWAWASAFAAAQA